ncbi:hypothetical protein D9757_003451 [Collybiopsis confluens]|uniref:MFS general substrate transporter n=1 Tax=Collybiopsis confluens TaxID=2823264 RepID=A0A8H5MCV1_9AGAR|nr:hypothetical protein D9757_003451 [Collybiopsis confluens]
MELHVLSSGAAGAASTPRIRQADFSHDDNAITEVSRQSPPPTSADNPDPNAESTASAYRSREYLQLGALYWCLFLAGWNDGSTGPLLPRIQEVYHASYIIVSLIFVFACVGFLCGALLNLPLSQKLGFGKTLVLGSALQQIAYALQAPQLPFPVFDAQSNGYVASLRTHSETKMGLLHASYGAGALCAPLVATQFSQLKHWSFHYLVSLSVATINTIVQMAVFRFKNQDDCLSQIGQEPVEKGTSEDSHFRQILSIKSVHLIAFFILVYVGVEVTNIKSDRFFKGGGPNSGYISAGFFGGLMMGRIALLWVNQKVGERRVLYFYSGLAIGLELVIWLVPSLIGDGVAIAIIGIS